MKIKQKLDRELSRYLGLKNTVLFSSCRNALFILIKSLEFKSDDEVIIQSFICDSLPQAIRKAGAKVIQAEVNEETLNLDAIELSKKITSNTKAVVFVHTYGNPSGIKEVAQLCEKHNLILIEDIAHALGAKYGGKLAGTFGDYTIYSFTKQMIDFGGGAVITNHDTNKLSFLREESRSNGNLLGSIKRLFASLYETRAFFLSKILIDIARKKSNLKQTNDLDKHFHCSKLEAAMAYWQFHFLFNQIKKKQRNFKLLQKYIPTQKIDRLSESSCNYLLAILPFKINSLEIKKVNFLFSLPWPGSNISDRIFFIPNSTLFSNKRILSIIMSIQRFIKTKK